MARRVLCRLAVAGAVAIALPMLAACGIVAGVAGAATRAAMSPVTGTAREVGRGVEVVSNSIERSAAASARAASQMQRLQRIQRASYAATRPRPMPVRPVAARPPVTRPAITRTANPGRSARPQPPAAAQSDETEFKPNIQVLPIATLALLTADQRELQKTAQNVALEFENDDVIFWDQDGRSGTATADDAHRMGGFICRIVTQSVTIDGKTEEASGTACHSGDMRWVLSF